jgi:hypothetical protein
MRGDAIVVVVLGEAGGGDGVVVKMQGGMERREP